MDGNVAVERICLLGFYILATSKGISGRVTTRNSVHSWQLYSAIPLGDKAPDIALGHIIQFLPYPNNAKHLAKKQHLPIFKSLV